MNFIAVAVCSLILPGTSYAASGPAPGFDQTIRPFLSKNCMPCHGEKMKSGGLNLDLYKSASDVTARRDSWESILIKVRTGEMPPAGFPRPAETDIASFHKWIGTEFARADKGVKPDPGRVTARRLNRYEYNNTIRDLLLVDFKPADDFPADDSGYGFDNIGDVLTVSPVLMEKYLNAAERIAAKAFGSEKLPKPHVERHKRDTTRASQNPAIYDVTHKFPYEAEYVLRAGTNGNRGKDGKPLKMTLAVDGVVAQAFDVETTPGTKRQFDHRMTIGEGVRRIRIEYVDDPQPPAPGSKPFENANNSFPESLEIRGPFAPKIRAEVSRARILTCSIEDGPQQQPCVRHIVANLAHRAWRRPVTEKEVSGLLRFADIAKQEGDSLERGLEVAVQAILVSPNFLFRIERDKDPTNAALSHRITDLELASRLSYFIWASMPDEELLRAAESKRLSNPAVLAAQVRRMVNDPKAHALAENFAGQWLELRNLEMIKPDPDRFPEFDDDLRAAMREETMLFFETMLKENRPIGDFLDARFTYLNERLARHYGIEGVTGPHFRRVPITTTQRGGVLTHASILAVSSYPTRTSPVIRGKYLLENILGAPPPPPPPGVPNLDETAVGSTGSLRQQLERHRSNATCASCHARMDVLGFGLENYDAIGRWRTVDGKFPIDPGGTFPNGKSFVTPDEMKTILRGDLPDFVRCLTEKMLTYALGRGLERYDRRAVEAIGQRLAPAGYRFGDLVLEVARSMPFQMRRGEQVKEVSKAAGGG